MGKKGLTCAVSGVVWNITHCPISQLSWGLTHRILDQWIENETGMKGPLKWHNQPEKNNKGLLESLQQNETKWKVEKQHKDEFKKDWQGHVLLFKMENNHTDFHTREICNPPPQPPQRVPR